MSFTLFVYFYEVCCLEYASQIKLIHPDLTQILVLNPDRLAPKQNYSCFVLNYLVFDDKRDLLFSVCAGININHQIIFNVKYLCAFVSKDQFNAYYVSKIDSTSSRCCH